MPSPTKTLDGELGNTADANASGCVPDESPLTRCGCPITLADSPPTKLFDACAASGATDSDCRLECPPKANIQIATAAAMTTTAPADNNHDGPHALSRLTLSRRDRNACGCVDTRGAKAIPRRLEPRNTKRGIGRPVPGSADMYPIPPYGTPGFIRWQDRCRWHTSRYWAEPSTPEVKTALSRLDGLGSPAIPCHHHRALRNLYPGRVRSD